VDARLALAAAAQKQAEETRVQIRKLHQAAVKKGGYKKFSIELESVRLPFLVAAAFFSSLPSRRDACRVSLLHIR
jgi:hypothetical protein